MLIMETYVLTSLDVEEYKLKNYEVQIGDFFGSNELLKLSRCNVK
jgi:hypothetical protein